MSNSKVFSAEFQEGGLGRTTVALLEIKPFGMLGTEHFLISLSPANYLLIGVKFHIVRLEVGFGSGNLPSEFFHR